MDHRDPNTTSSPFTSQNLYQDSDRGSTSATPDQDQELRPQRGKEPRRPRRRTLLTTGSGPWTYRSSDEDSDPDPNLDLDLDLAHHSGNETLNAQDQWNPRRSPNLSRQSTSPRDLSHDNTSRSKGKGRESSRAGSSSNTGIAEMGSTQPDRRQDNLSYQTTTHDHTSSRAGSSSSASPREMPQGSRSDRKKDRSDKSTARSRLVSGVFVRY